MFSVIIPNYNREQVILKAISSVLEQTYPDFELIVVDDCSTDDSRQIIEEVKDSRLRLLQMPKNSGAAAARNYGIKHSKGNYISLLDSDDFYEPRFLEASLRSLDNTTDLVGFSWTGVRYIEGGNVKEQIWHPKRKETPYLTLLNSLHIGTNSGITFKRNVFKKVGYFNDVLPAAEDTDFFLRISKQFDYCTIPEILINIERDGAERLSKNFRKIALSYNIFLPEHFPVIDNDKTLQAKYYYKMMWLNFHLKDKIKANYYYDKIPDNLKDFKFKSIKMLYENLPLKVASYLHKTLSGI